MRRRLRNEEDGFTLVEALVAMVMMLTVMFALYSIFDMSLRVFSFGNDKTEAVENARLGVAKMERELRAAYPYDQADDPSEDHLFWSPGAPSTPTIPPSDQITFGNDLNGNRKIDGDESNEQISYEVYTTGDDTLALGRAQGGGDNEPVVEYVKDVDGDGQALTFKYLDEQGNEVTTDEADMDIVHIKLEISKDDRTQILETDVALRNRSS